MARIKVRENWTNKREFMLSIIGYTIGLGNVWRFPYRAYQNGGASFLIPYIIVLVTAGLPLFFLEMALGQYASLGPVSVWKCVPFFKGVGWGMIIINSFCSIYFNMIIAYTIRYFFASLTSELPWQRCRPEWEQYHCVDRSLPNATLFRNLTKEFCEELRIQNETNSTDYISICFKPMTPSEIYWEKDVLNKVDSIDDPDGGTIKWDLALCLLLAWVFVFFCLIKGIRATGKIVYFTTIFPYVVLFIFLIWNARLEGAGEGIKFYVIPRWERLADAKVWYSAGTQIFYSLGIAFGALHNLSSYNKFKNNIYRDAVFITLLNGATSILAGFVVFSVMGFMAQRTGLEVKDVVAGGPGLAFIAYPEGIALMPVPQLWSVLFFLMLFTIGIDSQFAQVGGILTTCVDEFPFLEVGRRKLIFFACMCTTMYLIGLSFCTRAGIFAFTVFDWYSAGLNIIIIALLEITAISYIYGFKNFSEDIKMMIGHKPNYYFIVTWLFFTPATMLFLFIFSCVQNTTASYGDYVFPAWLNGIGWLMFAITMLAVLIVASMQTYGYMSVGENWKAVFKPTYDWGPCLNQFRTGRYAPIDLEIPSEPTCIPGTFTPTADFYRPVVPGPLENGDDPPSQLFDNPSYTQPLAPPVALIL